MISIQQVIDGGVSIVQPFYGEPLIYALPIPKVQSGNLSNDTFKDSKRIVTTSASYWNDYVITPRLFGTVIESTNTAVAIISSDIAIRVADGIAGIRGSFDGVSTELNLDFSSIGGGTVFTFDGYVADSVADILSGELLELLDAANSQNLFEAYSPYSMTPSRTMANMLSGVDVSGIGYGLSLNGGSSWTQANAPTLITPRHAVGARHWGFDYTNAKARWVTNDGTVVERAIIGTSSPLQNGNPANDDIIVFTLASDVSDITPFAVAGDWIRQDLVDSGMNVQFAGSYWSSGFGFFINQQQKVCPCVFGHPLNLSFTSILRNVVYSGSPMPDMLTGINIISGPVLSLVVNGFLDSYSSAFVSPVTGDSGKPSFVFNDREPILVSVFSYSNFGPLLGINSGAVLSALISNADTNAGVSTGYSPTIAPEPSP